ncbi:hypothetical protein EMIHUDRAFT_241307 [Emiliania huxleyi CCMP1516]|uniref:Uncharacterized protein n=2 Tax=Emiliania huxleyi TaxID=2903 RepID=A0A0D3JCV3_EMIH1|nr:hypothetical protein EMIHUDRAFT_241307 [Emiliania huxleyi CCMP1516]EOD21338.1 hypothetical protein EMIHUDRAFT_241307 [Emiliania huxleyi CCMP1516]|eukprot:XP_005773767.1 hypothetical protein EMIHUDRAFT_241307 [Emiliania huxleyi CCMP1516]
MVEPRASPGYLRQTAASRASSRSKVLPRTPPSLAKHPTALDKLRSTPERPTPSRRRSLEPALAEAVAGAPGRATDNNLDIGAVLNLESADRPASTVPPESKTKVADAALVTENVDCQSPAKLRRQPGPAPEPGRRDLTALQRLELAAARRGGRLGGSGQLRQRAACIALNADGSLAATPVRRSRRSGGSSARKAKVLVSPDGSGYIEALARGTPP